MKCKTGEGSKHDIPITCSIMYFLQIIHAKKAISLKWSMNLSSELSVNPSVAPNYLHSHSFSNNILFIIVYNPIQNIYFSNKLQHKSENIK